MNYPFLAHLVLPHILICRTGAPFEAQS